MPVVSYAVQPVSYTAISHPLMTDNNASDNDRTDTETDSDFFTHDDWEHGETCPSCGNYRMRVVQISTEIYNHSDGENQHVMGGEFRDALKIECDECNELLLRHPAMDAINAV